LPATTNDLDVLRREPWFSTLPTPLQERIAAVAVMRNYRKSQHLIRQDDPPRGFFGIVSGRTRHVCSVGDDHEVLMHVGGPGLWIGEYVLLSRERAIASVIADEPTRALFLPLGEWDRMVDEQPRWLRPFAELMAQRFALAIRGSAAAQALPREEWLHERLRHMAALERGVNRDASAPDCVTLSQSQLATMVGVSRQTLSSLLAHLQARGLLRVGYRRIELLS
jgi:CRP/FNR family transcriptional regulator, cyclic AMP receptor protein